MGITNSNKELNTSHIDCGDSFKVKLSLTAEPDILNNPTDIVLILDRSRSMSGSPLANLKNGAKKLMISSMKLLTVQKTGTSVSAAESELSALPILQHKIPSLSPR